MQLAATQLVPEQVVFSSGIPDGQSAQVDPHWRYPLAQLAMTQLSPAQLVLPTPSPDGHGEQPDPHCR